MIILILAPKPIFWAIPMASMYREINIVLSDIPFEISRQVLFQFLLLPRAIQNKYPVLFQPFRRSYW
jgi:hypothetical protein